MIYISTAQLGNDIQNWASRLPRFAAICGVPRAGTVIASLLAQHQNTHLISLNDLVWGVESWKEPLRRNCPGGDGQIFVVDDTVSSGEQMRKTKELLKDVPYQLAFGAYLAMNTDNINFWHKQTNQDHLFQLNIFHHWFDSSIMTDLDGVLSEDWNHDHETGDLAQTYHDHLRNSWCLIRPTFPMHSIVTGRLEIHREVTEAWLARNQIRYTNLIMYPASRPEDRHDVGSWKGEIFKQSNARLFIESCPLQSMRIKSVSGKDTLDWQNQRLV